jgi:hypothetical protein
MYCFCLRDYTEVLNARYKYAIMYVSMFYYPHMYNDAWPKTTLSSRSMFSSVAMAIVRVPTTATHIGYMCVDTCACILLYVRRAFRIIKVYLQGRKYNEIASDFSQ